MNLHVWILVAGVVFVAGNHAAPDPAFQTIVANLIQKLQVQNDDANHGMGELAAVVMVSQLEKNNWAIDLQPQGPDGHPLIDFEETLSPQNADDYVNFIVAIQDGAEAEQQILPQLQQLLQRFRQTHQNEDPAEIIIFSHTCPCRDCTDNIIQTFQELNLPAGVDLTVTCTSTVGGPNIDPDYSWTQFNGEGMLFFHFGLSYNGQCLNLAITRKLDEGEMPYESLECHSVQSYLMSHLGNSLGCCVFPATTAVTADFINRLMSKCYSELATLDTCIGNAVIGVLGGACSCLSPTVISTTLAGYINDAMRNDLNHFELYFLSHPLDPENPTNIMNPITSPDQLNNYEPFDYTCNDVRGNGLLCSTWDPSYVSAGNTVCRADSQCGRHEYSYSWCYVDHDNNWEYCCTDTCDYRGEDYRWCNAGSEWEYCGTYTVGQGLRNIKNQECLPTYPCGKHTEYSYYYWCYTDDTEWNWDYCCIPENPCSSTGSCYTGDSNSAEEDCQI